MATPLPGSPEFFFEQVTKFLRVHAQGNVRCIVITDTDAKQLWINSMIDNVVWELGILETAMETIRNNYRRNQEKSMAEVEKAEAEAKQSVAEDELRIQEVKGKPQ